MAERIIPEKSVIMPSGQHNDIPTIVLSETETLAVAKSLYEEFEHLDPTPDHREFEKLADHERDFYRLLVVEVLRSLREIFRARQVKVHPL